MKRILLILMSMALFSTAAQAARIKDVAQVAGVRSNQLVGYGLVSGLPGTGESNPFTEQSFAAMLQNFGIQLPPGTKPKIKNVAAVMVTATLPPFSKPGQQVDVTISSIGSAKSLRYGTGIKGESKGKRPE